MADGGGGPAANQACRGVEQAPSEAAGELLSMAVLEMYPGADSGLTVSDEDRLDAELLASVRG